MHFSYFALVAWMVVRSIESGFAILESLVSKDFICYRVTASISWNLCACFILYCRIFGSVMVSLAF